MATLTLTLTSATIPGSPVIRTLTFDDANLPNILAAFRALTLNPSMTAGDVVTFISTNGKTMIQNITQRYLATINAPTPPVVSES